MVRNIAHPDSPELTVAEPVVPLTSVQQHYRQRVLQKFDTSEYGLESVPVCLCGAADTIKIASQDRFGLPVGVVACLNCGLARTSPRLAAVDLPRFYQEDYHGLHMGMPQPSPSMALYREGQGRQIYGYVSPWLQLPRIRVAEVGCGTGQVLREFIAAAEGDSRTVTAIGCEYASAYVAAGKAAGSWIELGSTETLVPYAPFDLVILSHVVEHFADPERELQLIRQLLSEEGLAYIEVPGVLRIHRKPEYEYEFLRYLTVAHTYHFSLASLSAVLWRAGLERVAGDEEVRVLARNRRSDAFPPASSNAPALQSYLHWLESSRMIRSKRRLLRISGRVRSASSAALHRVLGERFYGFLRQARHSLRRRR